MSSSPTKIPHKLKKGELYIPSGNVYKRDTENGIGKFLGEMHDTVNIEKAGVLETRRYMAICDMDATIARECAAGRVHLYGVARWREIARRLNIPFDAVVMELG